MEKNPSRGTPESVDLGLTVEQLILEDAPEDGASVPPVENLQDGYDAYRQYIIMKSHFLGTYDHKKYGGKIRVARHSFDRRKDKIFFKIIQTKYTPVERNQIFLANFVYDRNLWIGECLAERCIGIWHDWKGRINRMDYQFEEDLKTALDELQLRKPSLTRPEALKILIKKPAQTHPLVLRFVWGGMFKIESYLLLSMTLRLPEVYKSFLLDDILWNDFEMKMKKYEYFLGKKLNINKATDIVKKIGNK